MRGKTLHLSHPSTTHPKYGLFTLCTSSEWPQCDCPLAQQEIACKHVMKVFKMLHPNILNGAIVKDMGTFHGVNKGPATIRYMVCDDLLDQEIDIKKDIGCLEMTTTST